MKVLWAILCQASVTDRDTNIVSLFNILEEVKIPAHPPSIEGEMSAGQGAIGLGLMELIVLWARSDPAVGERGITRLQMYGPGDDNPIGGTTQSEVDLTSFQRLRQRIRYPGFPVPTAGPIEGIYRIVIERQEDEQWHTAAEVPIVVTREEPPAS